jgi:hypothetical protein
LREGAGARYGGGGGIDGAATTAASARGGKGLGEAVQAGGSPDLLESESLPGGIELRFGVAE